MNIQISFAQLIHTREHFIVLRIPGPVDPCNHEDLSVQLKEAIYDARKAGIKLVVADLHLVKFPYRLLICLLNSCLRLTSELGMDFKLTQVPEKLKTKLLIHKLSSAYPSL